MPDKEIYIKYFVIKLNQAFNIDVLKKNIENLELNCGRYATGREIAEILLKAMVT